MMKSNQFNQSLTTALVRELGQHPQRRRFQNYSISFYEKNQEVHYRLKNHTHTGIQSIEHAFSFQQLGTDAKQVGGYDTNILVFTGKVAELYLDVLPLVIANFILRHVNADTYEVITDKRTAKLTFDLDPINNTLTWRIQIKDPINRLTFADLLAAANNQDLHLTPNKHVEHLTNEQAPFYQLTLIIPIAS